MSRKSHISARRRWLLPLLLALSAPGSIFTAGASQAASEVIFDMVPLFAPTSEQKTVPFFRSQRFEAGSGCTLSYSQSGGSVQTSWDVLQDATTIRSLFRTSPAQIVTWWADPALCSKNTKVTSGPNWVEIAVPGPQQTAQSVTFMQDKINLRVRSVEQFIKRFGTPSFASEHRLYVGNKNNEYASVKFGQPLMLGDYQSLSIVLDAKLVKADVNTGCVADTISAGLGQKCYDKRKHRTHFRIGFGNILWQDRRCSKNVPSDPICKYQNKYFQAMLSLYNDVFPFFNEDFHIQVLNDGRRIPIFRMDLRELLPQGVAQNPFRIQGNRTVARGNILPALKRAIVKAEKLCHLPPRLINANGQTESDDEYLAHYSLRAMNIGYEITGLSDMSFDVYRFSFTGVKQTANQSISNMATDQTRAPSRC